jgi:hypothetical protein
LYYQPTQSIHVTDGITVTSLKSSLLQMISVATDRECKIALVQKLSHKCEKWCKFSSHVAAKSCKSRPACHVKMTIQFIPISLVLHLRLWVEFSSMCAHRYYNMNSIGHLMLISCMLHIKDSFSSSLVYTY